jgi:hypothetical protein
MIVYIFVVRLVLTQRHVRAGNEDPADNHDQANQLFKKLSKRLEWQRTSHEGQTALRRVYREIFELPDDDFIVRKNGAWADDVGYATKVGLSMTSKPHVRACASKCVDAAWKLAGLPQSQEGTFMANEEIKPEMKVMVDVEGVQKPAKVIGPPTLRVSDKVTITGWVVHIEPSALPYSTTPDKIHPGT